MVSQSRLQLQDEDKWWEREIPRMREHNRLEAKRAKGGLPHSIWETYSSFANTDGGVILLGVSENPDHSLSITGVDDAYKMVQDFGIPCTIRRKSVRWSLAMMMSTYVALVETLFALMFRARP